MGTFASTLVDRAGRAVACPRPGRPAIESLGARGALGVAACSGVLAGIAAGASVVAWRGAAAPVLARHAVKRVALNRR